MEKVFITTPEQALAILLKKNPDAAKIENNFLQMRKIFLSEKGNAYCGCFVWCIKISANIYVGITEHGIEHNFSSDILLNWFPYNGEWINSFTQVFFTPKGFPYLSIIGLPNGEATRETILKGDYRARGEMQLVAVPQYKGCSQVMIYFWAMRTSMHDYSAASIVDGKYSLINNHDIEKIYHNGDEVMGRFVLEGNVLVPKK